MFRNFTLMLAGSMLGAGPAVAQDQDHQQYQHRQGTLSQSAQQPAFVSSETLMDATVIAQNGDDDASIEDFVVDLRSGRILFAVINTNGVMELEDRTVPVPYGALAWRPADETFSLNADANQLRGLPAFNEDNLAILADDATLSSMRGAFGEQPELDEIANARGYDEYSCLFKQGAAESKTHTGKVVGVNRTAKTARGATWYAVILQDDETTTPDGRHLILIGPVEHLESESAVPAEGQTITVAAVRGFNHEGQPVAIARTVTVDGRTCRLRDDHGAPAWSSNANLSTTATASPYALASELADGAVYASSAEFGDVNDIIFEAHSGAAAFVLASVGGVVGIGDTLYPVPFSTLVIDQDMNLHASVPADKLKVAPRLSDEGVDDFKQAAFAQRICDYYDVKKHAYDTQRANTWNESSNR